MKTESSFAGANKVTDPIRAVALIAGPNGSATDAPVPVTLKNYFPEAEPVN